jgi:ribosome-associated protein
MKEKNKEKEPFEKYLLCTEAALNKKAIDLVILDVKNYCSFTDYFIICSGKSDRQVRGISQYIEEELKKRKVFSLGIEGISEGKWVLMDYNDVVIHIFYAPVREYYDLESLWSDAKRVPYKD